MESVVSSFSGFRGGNEKKCVPNSDCMTIVRYEKGRDFQIAKRHRAVL